MRHAATIMAVIRHRSMPMRKLEYLWKDGDSGGGGCPALYRTEGGYVVQGVRIGAEERAQLRLLDDDEDAVFVPANVLDRIKDLA
jgi:hypothetical protein